MRNLKIKSLMFFALYSAFQYQVLAESSYTIYLVRHAEKQTNQKNPPLTQCGIQRVEQLTILLENITLDTIYSSNYKRTMATAKPVANNHGLTIEAYDPGQLVLFAKKLTADKKNALVVGHSNTTPQLAQLLSNSRVEEITEKEYQGLYQVTIIEEQAVLAHLKQPWQCK